MSTPQSTDRERLLRRQTRRMFAATVGVMTIVYCVVTVLVVGSSAPEEPIVIPAILSVLFFLIVPSVLVATILISKSKRRLVEQLDAMAAVRRTSPSMVGYSASGRAWKLPALLGVCSLPVLLMPLIALSAFDESGMAQVILWLYVFLIVVILSALVAGLTKRTISVDQSRIRREGRMSRHLDIPWAQVARIECHDQPLFSMLGFGKHPYRYYFFKATDGRMLGFINPRLDLNSSDAKEMERVLLEQAATHNIDIIPSGTYVRNARSV